MKAKATGIVRRVDALGRIVLPVELRRTLNIDVKDMLEISVAEGQIILRVCKPACIFCSGTDHLTEFEGKNVCRSCMKRLQKAE